MAIKIPSAYELGFGQRVPTEPEPVAPLTPVDKSAEAEALSRGLLEMSGTLGGIAAGKKLHRGRMALLEKEKVARLKLIEDEKIRKAQAQAARSRAQVDLLNLQDLLSQGVKDIASRQDLTPEGKTQAFNEHMNGLAEKYKEAVPEDLRVEFNPVFARAALQARSGLTEAITRQADDRRLADGAEALAILEKMASENPSQKEQAKEQARAIIETLPLHETAKVAQKQVFESSIDSNEILNRLNQTGKDGFHTGLDVLLADLKKTDGEGNHTEYGGLDPKERERFIGQTQNAIAEDNRRREADRKAGEAAFRERARDTLEAYKEMKLSGLPVDAREENRIYKMLKGTEFEARYLAVKSQGESAEHIFAKLSEDPLSFGAAKLGVPVKPLNMTDPQAFSQGIAERFQVGARVKASLNMTFTPVLTAEEVKGLSGFLKKDLAGGGIDLMDSLTRTVGKRNVMGIAMQMANTDPELATVVRYVAEGEITTAREIAIGQEILKTKALKMPTEEDLRDFFWKEAGGALRTLPNNGAEAYSAFKAIYAAGAAGAGIQDGTFDDGSWFSDGVAQKAFKKAVGEIAEFNGAKVPLPAGVKEEDFVNSVKALTPNGIKEMGGASGMSDEETVRRIKNEGEFYLAGDGIYRVRIDGLPVLTRDKKKFLQFDFTGLDFRHPINLEMSE